MAYLWYFLFRLAQIFRKLDCIWDKKVMTQYFGYHKLTDVSIPQKTNSMKLRVHTFF